MKLPDGVEELKGAELEAERERSKRIAELRAEHSIPPDKYVAVDADCNLIATGYDYDVMFERIRRMNLNQGKPFAINYPIPSPARFARFFH